LIGENDFGGIRSAICGIVHPPLRPPSDGEGWGRVAEYGDFQARGGKNPNHREDGFIPKEKAPTSTPC